ncbi:MAG TPA: FCD domain-containing protein [Solirubrobacteraceae bacterium]|nr:FCD domain-containing protein [Solirubrobacteraceae bacterium]
MTVAPSSDEAFRLIQQLIAVRALAPGERLGTEEQIAGELGVTRPAVREAVRLLSRANLVRAARGPGGGVFVAQTPDGGLAQTVSDTIGGMLAAGLTSVAELTEVRVLLEVPLAGLAAERADRATIAKLRRAIDDADRHAEDESAQRETDQCFHWTIAEAAGNRVACALIAWSHLVLQPALKELIAPAIVEAVARDQHREIVAAIEERRPAVAERAMRNHLRYLGDLLETVTPLDG